MSTITEPAETSPAAVARLLVNDLDGLTDELVDRILTGEHAYAESTLITPVELREAVHANLDSVLRQLTGELGSDLHAARATGRLKAEYGFPLAAVLHAYRLAGRLVWDRMRTACADNPEILPDIGADVWRIIDEYSTAAAEEYGRAVSERTTRHAELLQVELRALFDGVLEPGRLHTAAQMLQLPATGTFLVVCAEARGAGDPYAGIDRRLRDRLVASHWMSDVQTRIGLLSLSTPQTLPQVLDLLRGEAGGRVGVSEPFTTPLGARDALRQAELAMASLIPGETTTETYGRSALPLALAHSPAAARELRDAVLGPVLALPEADRDALITTVRAWFDCGGSLAATAEALHYHRNTINHRLRRIEQLTGRDRSDPRAAAELYVAVLADRLFGRD
ncbi:PucR family transcriptional regulator [Tsukamurella paurometabola]|uniref:Carbohydrate diacid transcriptional activator CdaR n=1 Tax=Tsukamurella paurometabola TaxID=2061 RepID=A0A3P8KRP2_TSUPA|nr:helix-turn-helix domain-containing protein [Tsukamurella paurometabola]MBS4102174.1 helix-turn-helix domain-containing protein [Tsukamurella paurometabola]UEA82101.1 helix-turn-helix domain-containing protein [Tsukamurella paurometabola]VDR39137.1 carbohydrate diacid transcriptional activator CdaR [Tsukamurella paurometabola]